MKEVKKSSPGNFVFKLMLPGDVFHSNKQPSFVIKNKNSSSIEERWYLFGKLGRLSNQEPTIKSYDNYGTLNVEKWYYDNKLHRDNNLPAYIEYYRSCNISSQLWMICGKLGRTDIGSVHIMYRENKMIKYEAYQLNTHGNETHTVNYNKNGNKKVEWWMKDNKIHRDDLPAYKQYWPDGRIKKDIWCQNAIETDSVMYD